MYLRSLQIENLRTFQKAQLELLHPDSEFDDEVLPEPLLKNVTLLLGGNGSGKTTILKAIALAGLGPAISHANINERNLIRRDATKARPAPQMKQANIAPTQMESLAFVSADFGLHGQDIEGKNKTKKKGFLQTLPSRIDLLKRGELESFSFNGDADNPLWNPIFESNNSSFFMVGYGATRRVERPENFDMGARTSSRFPRAQRLQSLFEDSYSLVPLTFWLPNLQTTNPGRYTQVVHLIDRLQGPESYRFTGEIENGDFMFEKSGLRIPFRSLSDGYRAFLGWVGDLLYHICYGAPSGKKLVESSGIILVDEVDLHLHPKWQMHVMRTLAQALPRMQFIVTSHSPLIAGSLEWMNIFSLTCTKGKSKAERHRVAVHGLDADQVLLTDLFGMETTRAPQKMSELDELNIKAREGDVDAARELLKQMSTGSESVA